MGHLAQLLSPPPFGSSSVLLSLTPGPCDNLM
uniref:Uncharacterized protein n=1 Tax=Arundo donax TaxID=35708 RepID=A0A0A9BRU2_ARUDO